MRGNEYDRNVREKEVVRSLVKWFRRCARELPWRGAVRDPYHVLVSELMLQQTQVDRVVLRFLDFIKRFPTITQLAEATEEEVLASWSGLGYYRRALNLHRAARIVTRTGGEVPRDVESLRALPGVGAYTAAAVASLAYGLDAPVLDGNVMRVASRILARESDPRSAAETRLLTDWVSSLIRAHDGSSAEVNEALMELGAVVCTPKSPACGRCSVSSGCLAHAQGRPEAYPRLSRSRSARPSEELHWLAACCIDGHGHWLLKRVDTGPVLRRLWIPPLDQTGLGDDPIDRAISLVPGIIGGSKGVNATRPRRVEGVICEAVRHSITFRRITVIPVRIDVEHLVLPEGAWAWADPLDPGRPTSSLLGKLAARLAEG